VIAGHIAPLLEDQRAPASTERIPPGGTQQAPAPRHSPRRHLRPGHRPAGTQRRPAAHHGQGAGAVRHRIRRLQPGPRRLQTTHISSDEAWIGKTLPIDQSFCATTIRPDAPFVVPDALAGDENTPETDVRFYAGYPVHSINGTRIGAICVFDHEPRSADRGSSGLRPRSRERARQSCSLTRRLTSFHRWGTDSRAPTRVVAQQLALAAV